jgi:hypothetical protein
VRSWFFVFCRQIFDTSTDPVTVGLVASLNRPGGNLTGVSNFGVGLMPKRMELLSAVMPDAAVIAFLVNPTRPRAEFETRETQEAARADAARPRRRGDRITPKLMAACGNTAAQSSCGGLSAVGGS